MDHIWSPWRYQYVTKADPQPGRCIFCDKHRESDDVAALVVYRGEYNYVVLNLYPYSNGHVMVVPYEHIDSLAAARPETTQEMMALMRRTETLLRKTYSAPGINMGINLGECAGAGVAGHIHMHILPRWPGDANFMTAIGETRVHIEVLPQTYEKLRLAFACD